MLKSQSLAKNKSTPFGVLLFLVKPIEGFEPEGTWQHAGGMLQPEAASAAAEVESHPLSLLE